MNNNVDLPRPRPSVVSDHAILNIVEACVDSITHAAMTRRYGRTPSEYEPPTRHMRVLASSAMRTCALAERADVAARENGEAVEEHGGVPSACVLYNLAAKESPTYWIARDLLDALVRTERREDLLVGDITLPFDAFSVMLPRGWFTVEGREAYALVFCRNHPGVISMEMPASVPVQLRPARIDVGGDNLTALVFLKGKEKDTGDIVYRMTTPGSGEVTVRNVMEHSFPSPTTNVKDLDMSRFAFDLCIRISMFMTARPQMVEEMGKPQRRAKKKGGKMVQELWGPRWIGKNYRLPTGEHSPTGVKLPGHWRAAHWRMVAHGPKHSLHRLEWIEAYRTSD